MIGRGDVTAAAERIAGRVRRTPTLRLDDETVLKLEHLQHTGSFKARGAFNVVLGAEQVPETGLVAASGGNHALAVAHVARALGLPVEVFVPEVCPAV
ncbi:MAG: pyridoxal-phosphate dependent enzyme, partial [Acidimicrobiales bacterium]|nr:pyridoxal-phosphate dependent enzyme [Acidimicrobiales bacterium]